MQTDWNLSLLFKNEKDIAKERVIVEKETKKFVAKWSKRDDYLKDPKILRNALDEYSEWVSKWGAATKENYYYQLKSSLDQNDPKIKASFNKAQEFSTKLENEMQFFTIRISKIDKRLHKTFLKEKSLAPYKHYLEKLFLEAEHILEESEEKILNSVSPLTYGNWTRMVSGFLAKEEREVLNEKNKKVVKNFTEITGLLNDKNKKVRDSAAVAFNDILEKYVDVAENEINAVLQYKKVLDEMRHFDRPDQVRHLSDDIDTEVVDTLVSVVTSRFTVAKKYYALKAKLFGVTKLKYHERNLTYGSLSKKYTYEESVALVSKVFSQLDPEFAEIFSKFQKEGNIDVFPKKGKRGGAFASARTIPLPTYILLNHTEKVDDVRTLAHELGHGINNELIRAKQNELDFGTPVSTAEVASTFMEDFVQQELMKSADDELRLALMLEKLNSDISTIFRQIACYNLETDLHKAFREKGYLPKEIIGELFQKNMKNYMGPAVDQSEGSENWWVYWQHIRYFFYVYSYSSGLLISKSLQASVKKDPKFIIKVKEFLSAGMSDSPKNIFLKLGIDITKKDFWDTGLDEVETLLKETEKLAKKLGKI